MMVSVNLLPWREERRLLRDKKLLGAGVFYWLACVAVILLMLSALSDSAENQNRRNQFLTAQNEKLDQEIESIEKLKKNKETLLYRINVVQNLQDNRSQIVHVFDDMVRKLPKGVTLDIVSKDAKLIKLTGRAQSNSRVSELMNRLDSSLWFGETDLTVVNVTDEENNKISQFELVVIEKDLLANKETGDN